MIPTGLKDTATRMDIVNDFYDAIQRLQNTFKDQREAQVALAVLEHLAIWWANAPVVNRPPETRSSDT